MILFFIDMIRLKKTCHLKRDLNRDIEKISFCSVWGGGKTPLYLLPLYAIANWHKKKSKKYSVPPYNPLFAEKGHGEVYVDGQGHHLERYKWYYYWYP